MSQVEQEAMGMQRPNCWLKIGADIVIADICEDMPTIPYKLSTGIHGRSCRKHQKMGRKAIGIKSDVRKASDVEAIGQERPWRRSVRSISWSITPATHL